MPMNRASVPLRSFDRRYLAWGAPLFLACLLPLAWHWSLPGPYDAGAPFWQVAGVLAAAGLVVNLPSFWLQRRILRARWERGLPVRAGRFALRFYLVNLGLAAALSVLLRQPLLMLLFSAWIYPIAFWLTPYHALLGWLLGRWLERESKAPPRVPHLPPSGMAS